MISEAGGILSIALGPTGGVVLPMTHFDRNLFLVYPSEETPTLPSSVEFTVDASGRASEVVVGLLNGDGQGLLKRIPGTSR